MVTSVSVNAEVQQPNVRIQSIQVQLQVKASLQHVNMQLDCVSSVRSVCLCSNQSKELLWSLAALQRRTKLLLKKVPFSIQPDGRSVKSVPRASACAKGATEKKVRPKCYPHGPPHPAAVAFNGLPANQCWETPLLSIEHSGITCNQQLAPSRCRALYLTWVLLGRKVVIPPPVYLTLAPRLR